MIAQARAVGWRAWLSLFQLDHHIRAKGWLLLLAADPLIERGR